MSGDVGEDFMAPEDVIGKLEEELCTAGNPPPPHLSGANHLDELDWGRQRRWLLTCSMGRLRSKMTGARKLAYSIYECGGYFHLNTFISNPQSLYAGGKNDEV